MLEYKFKFTVEVTAQDDKHCGNCPCVQPPAEIEGEDQLWCEQYGEWIPNYLRCAACIMTIGR